MSASPIGRLLEAFDAFDLDAVDAMLAPDIDVLISDGRRAHGIGQARELIAGFTSALHSMRHDIVSEWQAGDVWVAEVEAKYELADRMQLTIPRAFIVRNGPDGIAAMHVYGAHEHPLTEHRTGNEGMWIGTRWIPPL
jgi:ketosteroid isomerase-like protein